MKLRFYFSLMFLFFSHHWVYAEVRTGMEADVVVGQPNFTTTSTGISRNKIDSPRGVVVVGNKLIIAEQVNARVLIYNEIPRTNNAAADVVLGQTSFTAVSLGTSQTIMTDVFFVSSDGIRLVVTERLNNRILIWNAMPQTNTAPADVVVGQVNFNTAATGTGPSAISGPFGASTDGQRLFVADTENNRILIWNKIPTANNAPADLVLGQPDFVTTTGAAGQSRTNRPFGVMFDGRQLFVIDRQNNRVLIWNGIPTTNGAPADFVIGQPNFTTSAPAAGPNRFNVPAHLYSDRNKLFVSDSTNRRVLVWNLPIINSDQFPEYVIGQTNFTASTAGAGRNKLSNPSAIHSDGKRLFVADEGNNRVLIYNIGSSTTPDLGPQFTQGKAVLGKVFNDLNSNEVQDEGENGLEGVKVASDTGIYAITDEDGKYHFPYIETGQRVLKIDTATLPEGAVITTESPRKTVVTEGILTKISFGIKLPQEKEAIPTTGPLLKVSVSEDPILLKPHLKVEAQDQGDNILFTIDCNYHLFIKKAVLRLYDEDMKKMDEVELPQPLPLNYALKKTQISSEGILYYQLSAYNKEGKEDRTGVGTCNFSSGNRSK